MNFNVLAPQAHLLMLSFTLHMSSRGGDVPYKREKAKCSGDVTHKTLPLTKATNSYVNGFY